MTATRILFGRVFGIGNAVLSAPAVKHYRDTPGYEVTVVVGTTPDDYGAYEVLRRIQGVTVVTDLQLIGEWRHGKKPHFDVGVLSIPHDGRWIEMFKEICDEVVDGRTRPDPSTEGLSSWRMHEAWYQLFVADAMTQNSRDIVCTYPYLSLMHAERAAGSIPDTSFWDEPITDDGSVYLGIGRKYDSAGFWERKHWGDDNFLGLSRRILMSHPDVRIVCTGGMSDMNGTGRVLMRGLADFGGRFKFTYFPVDPLDNSFRVLSRVGSYIGNDTGMMHVAASMDKRVVGVFNLEGTSIKNPPLCPRSRVLEGHATPVTVDQVYNVWRELQ